MRLGTLSNRHRDAVTAVQRREFASLLRLLARGERIAVAGALAQAKIAPDAKAKNFLNRQARQERFHAQVFEQGAAWIDRSDQSIPGCCGLDALQSAGQARLRAGDFLGSLLVQQIMLETVGHVVLHRLNRELARREVGLSRLRRLILHQEDGHQAFGLQRLSVSESISAGERKRLQEQCAALWRTADSLLLELGPALETLNEDVSDYRRDLLQALPAWSVPITLDS